jgi:hypothetical protein
MVLLVNSAGSVDECYYCFHVVSIFHKVRELNVIYAYEIISFLASSCAGHTKIKWLIISIGGSLSCWSPPAWNLSDSVLFNLWRYRFSGK